MPDSRLFPQGIRQLTLDDLVLLRLVPLRVLDARDLLDERVDNLGERAVLGAVLAPVPLPTLIALTLLLRILVWQEVREVGSPVVEDEVLGQGRDAVLGVRDGRGRAGGFGGQGPDRVDRLLEGRGDVGVVLGECLGQGQ